MQFEELKNIFAENDGEFLKFDRVTEKPWGSRPDLHAFNLLDKIMPGKRDIISAAEHDQIWLDMDVGELAQVATESQIIDLIRCGIMLDSEFDSLSLFV